jgi:hypothetical protein
MAGMSNRGFVHFGYGHSVQQVFEPSQAANLSDESQQFVETVESTNCFDRLGHRFRLLDGNGVCRFFNRCLQPSRSYVVCSVKGRATVSYLEMAK